MKQSPTPLVTIDVRMLYNSGIGVYLRNLLPHVLRTLDARIALMGRSGDFDRLGWLTDSRVERIAVKAPIYSIGQQFELPSLIPNDTAVYWAPHYDVPVLRKGRLLVTIHDVAHIAMPEIFSGFLKQAYARSMLQVVRRSAAHIMFVSEFSRKEFSRLVGLPTGSTSVTHLGLGESWRNIRPVENYRFDKRPYIVYVGNVKPHKNLTGLLSAFDLLRDRIPHDLILIGKVDGFLTGDSAVAARLRQSDPRIMLTGPLSDENVQSCVANAAALVLPSFYEGFGLPPIEAMAAGCPVAASGVASIPEICGDAVLYFNPNDVANMAKILQDILENRDLAAELKKKGIERAGRYRWDTCAKQVVKEIETLIN